MDGIICINKPSGWTSFDVVAKIRGITRTRKIGHAGTLDPMATGVLPLFFGTATKLCDILPNSEKGYLADFQLGCTTDTLDITGTVLTEQQSHVSKDQVEAALENFRGVISQLPPMYSAVQVNGRRLYDIARAGQTVERAPRQVEIKKLDLLSFDELAQTGQFRVLCSKGTYIRSLCSDLGEALGCGAVLTALVRECAGDFMLEDCLTLEDVQTLMAQGDLEDKMLPLDRVFQDFEAIRLNEIQAKKFQNGVKLDLNRVHYRGQDESYRVYGPGDTFLGLAKLDLEKMELVIEKMLKRN